MLRRAFRDKTGRARERLDMSEVDTYHLPPTGLVPNNPLPVLHYKALLLNEGRCSAARAHSLFTKNDWHTQWINRYGPTQPAHYHAGTHECMAVLCGSATIRFGSADADDADAGIEISANVGDVFILPAGVSHKTFNPVPNDSEFALLTPGEGHGVAVDEGQDVIEVLDGIELSGFCMIGAYPRGGAWDFAEGGEHVGEFEKVWAVPKPRLDPVMGESMKGLCGCWR